MDELQILIKAILTENSEQNLNSQLLELTKQLGDAHKISLKVGLDPASVKTVQSELQTIAKQVSSASNGAKSGGGQIKVFDSTQLQADGQRYFNGVRDIVARAQKEFSKMGKVDITNVFKDAKGDIQSFTASVTKADGVVEKFNFELAKIKNGTRNLSGFVQTNSILSDRSTGSDLEKTLNFLNRIDTKIADITSKTLKNTSKPLLGDMEQYNQYHTKLNEVKARIEEIKQANATLSGDHKREIASMVADLQRYAKELQKSAYAATDLNAATFANKKAELQAALQTDIKKWTGAGIFGGDFEAAVNKAKAALDSALDPTDLEAYKHQLALLAQEFKQFKLDKTASGKLIDADILTENIKSTQKRILNLKETYSSFLKDPDLLDKWNELFNSSQIVKSKKELQLLNAKIRDFEQELIQAGKHNRSLWDELKANAIKMGTWMVLGGVIAGIMRGITGLYDAVVDLDTAMTELKKVTNETDEAYDEFLSNAADKAVKIGTTYADFVNSSASFARLGYTIDDSSRLAEVANVYAVVGDEINGVDDATTSIISTMKAFNIEADNAISIVDKFNEVGNNFAISSGGIGEAMQRSAAALASANNTIDQSIALIVAANNVIQDPAMVGTMWKTVSMRIRGATTELEQAGLETEYMAESTADLQQKVMALTNVDGLGGFDIMLDSETFKSTYDIILGISKVWKDMSDIDQAALLELLAGKRQGNALAAALTNMEDAEAVLKDSVAAEGSAMREHEKWMESVEAKQQRFQAQYEVFANTILNSDLVKGTFDTGTGLLGFLTLLVDKIGALPILIGAATPFVDKLSNSMWRIATDADGNAGIHTFWKANQLDFDSDIRLLDEYAQKIKNLGNSEADLTQKQIIWNDTIAKGSSRLKDSIKVSDRAVLTTDEYTAATKMSSSELVKLNIKSRLASVGVTLLNTALNVAISFGISLVIQGIVTAIGHLVNATDEAIERTNELNEEFREFKATNTDNIETLKSLESEFETLSAGVSRYGENVALTADEYERYKEIVETIVGISPSLSEGYSTENGYLADKNGLLERAIELQEQQYQNELREMTTMAKLKTGMEGYIAEYGELWLQDESQGIENAMWKLYRISDRDLVPDFANVNGGDNKSVYLAEQIMKALGIQDINSEIEKYLNDYGYFQSDWFFDAYAEQIAQNKAKIVDSIDYSAIGFKTKDEFDQVVQTLSDSVTDYTTLQNDMAAANKGIADQLRLVAEANDGYSKLSDEAQTIVSRFVDRFGVEDVYTQNWWGTWIPDETKINEARAQINNFIDSLTPEVQGAISGLFDLKNLFDAGNISVDEFTATVDAIIGDLEAMGFDSESVKYLRLSLETDLLDEQLEAIKEAIGGLNGEYDADLGSLSAKELRFAYKIVAEEGSMTFEELIRKVQNLKYQSADMVNVLDFSDLTSDLDKATEGLEGIISAMDRLRSGTALTKEQLANLALEYPNLLEQSDLFVDGSIEGQQKLLGKILETYENEYNASLDTKIAELKATEALINEQLSMETQKANLIADIKNISVNGIVGQEEELVNKISELNDLQGQNYVTMENGMLVVNGEALNEKLNAEDNAATVATANIWQPYGNAIISAHTQGFASSLHATESYTSKLGVKVMNIISGVWSALGEAVRDATTGNWQGLAHYFRSAVSGMGDTSISANAVTVTFDGGDAWIGTENIDSWISAQEEASEKRIEALEDFRERTVNAYTNLEALRGLDLTSIYGSAGNYTGSGNNSSNSEKDKAEESVKEVEEYIAAIDEYYEALKNLEAAQERRQSLEKQLEHTDDFSKKIFLASSLVGAYENEANAEKNLMAAKKTAISANVGALRGLGFEVDYDSSTNKLFIKNLEHLNELTASTTGEYETLQEATNALRKETEEMIDVTEQLNDDNIAAAGTIEDLGYQVLETKKDIVSYIEEIYNKQVEAYREIIDLRKELIESAKDEYDYESDIADKVKEIAELQSRIDQLALDDSRSALAERRALEEELANLQADLSQTQSDHSTDAQLEALDKLAEDYEKTAEEDIAILQNTVNATEGVWNTFYDMILGKNVTVGDSINTEIANAWLRAAEAVQAYGVSVNDLSGVSTVVGTIPKYHTGGVVTGSNLGSNELLAVLEEGEVVFTKSQFEDLFASMRSTIVGVVDGLLGRLAKSQPAITEVTDSLVNNNNSSVFSPHIRVNISHNGDMTDADAKSYGEKVADTAIGKLYSAFERRGISSNRGSRLKP